ncbi:MAG: DUF4491 family protein [Anaerolineales bacterium]|nr:DUF4491 family protein [Anaerolineales bacterium]
MSLNTIGLVAALATFFGIWFGHVAVRKIEFVAPNIWLPTIGALLIGLGLEATAALSTDLRWSAFFGILGITFLWDALEFTRQQKRVKVGHAPANPDNPRHARILAEHLEATTIDWLDRSPEGRQIPPEEMNAIQEGAS